MEEAKLDDEVKGWLEKIKQVKDGSVDLSRDEDLSIALMNLISIEEHLYFSAMKTDGQHYLELLNSVRHLRTKLLGRMVTDPKGEEWCISKHLLAASMRLIEVGTKELAKGEKASANGYFKAGFELYSLFFAINLRMMQPDKLAQPKGDKTPAGTKERFSAIMKKILDCCKEW